MLMGVEKVQTSLRLPRPIYEQAKSIVEERLVNVASFNDLVVAALLAYIKRVKRRQIDLAFRAMAEDTDFQKEASLISAEFEESDWEAFETGEKLQGALG
ncbi:MAG: hypothetical protein A3G20_02420 [Acidobacteria bacterium RIFCSPLOWO2_12_FULL_59_11]|nr:MAG: hypothetical protein A3G20_02420 [Acidobacteria bacterium RIFCSPLOWO2_12_FULL_59_11]